MFRHSKAEHEALVAALNDEEAELEKVQKIFLLKNKQILSRLLFECFILEIKGRQKNKVRVEFFFQKIVLNLLVFNLVQGR